MFFLHFFTIFLFFSFASFAKDLTACYRAYYLFLPVAQTCITYTIEEKNVYTKSWAKTVNVGKVAKRVNNKGESHMTLEGDLRPKLFRYQQEEGLFKRDQEYRFEKGKIYVTEIKYVDLSNQIEQKTEGVYAYQNSPDPYMASLILLKESIDKESGFVSMFYDEKYYKIPFKVIKKEEVLQTNTGTFRTRIVEVQPNIHTKGLLKPTGNWRLWIDNDTNLLVKMQLSFVIGSVTARLEEIKGDRSTVNQIIKLIQ